MRPAWFRPTACRTTCSPMRRARPRAGSKPSSPAPAARPTCRACWRPKPQCRCWACRWPAAPAGRGLAAQHRADAQGHPGGHLCHWQCGRGQCGPVRRRAAGQRRPGIAPEAGGVSRQADRGCAQHEPATRMSGSSGRHAGRHGRRPARPHVRTCRAAAWGISPRCSTPTPASPAGLVSHHHMKTEYSMTGRPGAAGAPDRRGHHHRVRKRAGAARCGRWPRTPGGARRATRWRLRRTAPWKKPTSRVAAWPVLPMR
jgi:hypothetical protein